MENPVSSAPSRYKNFEYRNYAIVGAKALTLTAAISTLTYLIMKETQRRLPHDPKSGLPKYQIEPFKEGHIPASLAWATLTWCYFSFGVTQFSNPKHSTFLKFINSIQGQCFKDDNKGLIQGNMSEFSDFNTIVGHLNDPRYAKIRWNDVEVGQPAGTTLSDALKNAPYNMNEEQIARVLNQLEVQALAAPVRNITSLFCHTLPGSVVNQGSDQTEVKLSTNETHCIVDQKREGLQLFQNQSGKVILTLEITYHCEVPKTQGGEETAFYTWKITQINNNLD